MNKINNSHQQSAFSTQVNSPLPYGRGSLRVVVLLLVFCSASAQARVAQVRLTDQVELGIGAVTLGMIAEVSVADGELKKRLTSLVVGEVREGMTQSSIGVYDITRALARARIVPGSVDVYGAKHCRIAILRSGVVGSGTPEIKVEDIIGETSKKGDEDFETIGDRLAVLVQQQSGLDGKRLKIEWRGRHVESFLGQTFSELRYRFKPRSTLGAGSVTIEVIDRDGKGPGEPKTTRVSGVVSYLCESVVATRALQAGDVIGVDDVKLLSRRVQSLRDLGLDDVALVVGQEVARRIDMNMVITPKMIKQIELVHRRDVVRVYYNDGRVSLSLQARAEQNGCLGDTIKVYDFLNKQHFYGRIVGDKEVEVLQGER